MTTARGLIDSLALQPHPEGGWYRQTWRGDASDGAPRGSGTSILFLLEEGQRSHWHRVDASELWIFQAGAPLLLSTAQGERGEAGVVRTRLGCDPEAGESPQHLVQPFEWQAAHATDGWSLVTCVVVPGFTFDGFELAPPDWTPQA